MQHKVRVPHNSESIVWICAHVPRGLPHLDPACHARPTEHRSRSLHNRRAWEHGRFHSKVVASPHRPVRRRRGMHHSCGPSLARRFTETGICPTSLTCHVLSIRQSPASVRLTPAADRCPDKRTSAGQTAARAQPSCDHPPLRHNPICASSPSAAPPHPLGWRSPMRCPARCGTNTSPPNALC